MALSLIFLYYFCVGFTPQGVREKNQRAPAGNPRSHFWLIVDKIGISLEYFVKSVTGFRAQCGFSRERPVFGRLFKFVRPLTRNVKNVVMNVIRIYCFTMRMRSKKSSESELDII